MKRLTLVLAVVLLFLSSISCGGGGGTTLPPANRDLSGLEGTWLIASTFSCNMNCDDGTSGTFGDSASGTWEISRNTIFADEPLVWSYNGSELTVNLASLAEEWDANCGTLNLSIQGQMKINITPGATFANFTCNAELNAYSEYCGNCSGPVVYSGTIAKQ